MDRCPQSIDFRKDPVRGDKVVMMSMKEVDELLQKEEKKKSSTNTIYTVYETEDF